MIAASSLRLEIGDRVLVEDASFVVGSGEKAGLVGSNGAGKSSLVSVLIGERRPHLRFRGHVATTGTLGYLPQAPVPGGLGLDPSGFSHVLSGRGLDVLDDALGQARIAMAECPSEENIAHFSDLEEEYRRQNGYEAEAVMSRLADGLGLKEDLLFEPVESLSGGQRRRADLVRVLFTQPDIMVLDEPTNHLDLSAKRWLMDELARYPGTLLVISHDLALLDRAIGKVLHLRERRILEYKGNYSAFKRQSAADQERTERAAVLEGREIKRLATLADSLRKSTEKKARLAKTLDKRVDRLQANRTEVLRRERRRAFKLPTPKRTGDVPLAVQKVAVRYGPLSVLHSVDFLVGRGDRVAVVGRNGVGKSSLLRCLAGVQAPSGGEVREGANVAIGYFAQEHEQIDPKKCALDNLDDEVLVTEAERRALLGTFGLTGKASMQPAGTLSGGERAKLGLAMLAAGRCNVLLLDEPTNNLDPASIDALGAMLSTWPGTLVVVSHERAFIEALEPTHALLLPGEQFTQWREEYADLVALR
ncbi:MAG TPA: ABC-F family ATP-binding cassette domain-containing protein [Acidimicrobiales bacterium]|nr:ABC-F family ATP-binding cassette domain-containing protein [Acidimicrobiales bacterium]